MSKKVPKDLVVDNKPARAAPVLAVPLSEMKVEATNVTDKAFVVVGNVDAGKSTLIGTLTSGLLDDGRGSARAGVARHQHEIDAGKTSDVSTRVLTFPNGKTATLIDLCGHEKYFSTTASGISGMWPDYAIVVVSPTRGILDMTKQHFKMLMSYNIPVLFVVTRVDMALEDSCKIVDKEIKDLCKTYKRQVEFMNGYAKYHAYERGAKLVAQHKLVALPDDAPDDAKYVPTGPIKVSDKEEAYATFTEHDVSCIEEYFGFETSKLTMVGETNQGLKMAGGKQTYIPVVYVSNVDGYCLDVVKHVMMTVEPRDLWAKDDNASSIVKFFKKNLKLGDDAFADTHVGCTFYIDNTYNVNGVGLVISGINRGDAISVNDELYIGPIGKDFVKVKIRSIHNDNRKSVDKLANHHRGCIAIKPLKNDIKKNQITRGTVMISKPEMVRNVCYRFEAAVTIFGEHSATLRTGYSPVVHAGTIRQAAKLILPDDNLTDEEQAAISALSKRERKATAQRKIKAGDVARVTFKFRMHPEYVDVGTVFVFRSGDLHGVGCVIGATPLDKDTDAQPEPLKKKFRKVRPSDREKERETVLATGIASTKKPSEKIVVKQVEVVTGATSKK
ncbi:putative GTP-binding translation elongation/initiation factor [Yasminevirus sp. GU-2018]|uniref:Putative GTP-binding translation elongation/initiation factor n=1 Tax=Yasminevirus sp. GU-2018 TaxID=2420051 RepID=A0A5K0U980_9VIRU|nr:putative GTP-binding translation elongation/initiation factor [Yasminevirus sp. GU-2018]